MLLKATEATQLTSRGCPPAPGLGIKPVWMSEMGIAPALPLSWWFCCTSRVFPGPKVVQCWWHYQESGQTGGTSSFPGFVGWFPSGELHSGNALTHVKHLCVFNDLAYQTPCVNQGVCVWYLVKYIVSWLSRSVVTVVTLKICTRIWFFWEKVLVARGHFNAPPTQLRSH